MRISLVHLSDIHFTEFTNPVADKVAQLAAAIFSTDPTCSEYVIVLSGDIAYRGIAEEYEVARSFFAMLEAELKNRSGAARLHYVSVPGNHDCVLPESGVAYRDALIVGIRPTIRSEAPDNSILAHLLASQEAYFEFAGRLFPASGSPDARLCRTVQYDIDDYKLQFNLYNSALLSRRNEKQGELSVPIELVRRRITNLPDSSLSIAVIHHSYPWIDANVGVELRHHIETTADVVLMGHQHFDHSYMKMTSSTQHIFYSEGSALQEGGRPDSSGFRVIVLDLFAGKRRIVTYKWKPDLFSRSDDSDWQIYSRTPTLSDRITATPSLLADLRNSSLGLVHPSRGVLALDELFVYPDVAVTSLSSSAFSRDISGPNLFAYFCRGGGTIVQGGARSGKTSLGKMLALDWLRSSNVYPLSARGADFSKSDQTSVEKFMRASAAASYGDTAIEKYEQLPPAQRAIIIDDWDDCPMGGVERNNLLYTLNQYFGHVIVFVNQSIVIDQLMAKLNKTAILGDFDHVILKEMSFAGRGDLIDRWISLDFSRDTSEFHKKVEETDRLVKTLIGKNTLPSLPFIVVSILEAARHQRDTLPENGSFGYLYEVLITAALNRTKSERPQLDKKYTFLAILAFHLFDRGTDTIGAAALDVLLDEYGTKFKVRIDKDGLLADLRTSRVIVIDSGNYSFGYQHYYDYFLARYFKYNMDGPDGRELRKRLTSMAANLPADRNSSVLMFVMYLTHDDRLTDELLAMGNSVLRELTPARLEKDVEFYGTQDVVELPPIPEQVDREENRKERREAADQSKGRQNGLTIPSGQAYSDSLSIPAKLKYASAYAELLGQIVRNFTGSLPGDRKIEILTAICRLSLRTLSAYITAIAELTREARQQAKRKDLEKADKNFAGMFARLIDEMGHAVGFAVIQGISYHIGSPDIDERAYAEALDLVGKSNATELINLAILLDHSVGYPLDAIKDLNKRFTRDNRYAQRVLYDVVVANLRIVDIGHKMLQRVIAEFKSSQTPGEILAISDRRVKKQ